MFFSVRAHRWWLCCRPRWLYSRYVCKKGVKESGKFNFVSVGLYPRDLYVGKRSRVNWSGAEMRKGRHAKEEKRESSKKTTTGNILSIFNMMTSMYLLSLHSHLYLSHLNYKTVKNIYSSTTVGDEKFHIRFLRLHDLSFIHLGWELTLN